MNDALTYIHYILTKCINFVFNDMEIAQNITIGWIAISIFVFSILISSILNLPRRMASFDMFREHTYVSNVTDSHGNKHWYQNRRFRR